MFKLGDLFLSKGHRGTLFCVMLNCTGKSGWKLLIKKDIDKPSNYYRMNLTTHDDGQIL